ncbi:Hypothetical protein FKW44_016424, partial [Caligus rogercresseyi]
MSGSVSKLKSSLKKALDIIEDFKYRSGLIINTKKSQIITNCEDSLREISNDLAYVNSTDLLG